MCQYQVEFENIYHILLGSPLLFVRVWKTNHHVVLVSYSRFLQAWISRSQDDWKVNPKVRPPKVTPVTPLGGFCGSRSSPDKMAAWMHFFLFEFMDGKWSPEVYLYVIYICVYWKNKTVLQLFIWLLSSNSWNIFWIVCIMNIVYYICWPVFV